MSYDDPDDITYNPFAEERDYSPATSKLVATDSGHYSSSFFPKSATSRPSLRLRKAGSIDKTYTSDPEDNKKHVRTRSDSPKSAGLHPLKSALAGLNGAVFPDLGITRPHLSRLVSDPNAPEDVPESSKHGKSQSQPSPPQEKDVIVHHVTPKDSLAGVSLKYGISLANLRRANQLWTSDTIHRRDVLYIPIDQASRARDFIPQFPLITFTPDAQEVSTDPFTTATSPPIPERDNSEPLPSASTTNPSVNIRRVPASQLSFFPPSTSRDSDSRLLTDSPSPTKNGASNSRHGGDLLRASSSYYLNRAQYTSSPAGKSLSSILGALPIGASTRDEIMTRLSLDSTSSSFSERSRASSATEDDGHELNEVITGNRRWPRGLDLGPDNDNTWSEDLINDVYGSAVPTPKASQRVKAQKPHQQRNGNLYNTHRNKDHNTLPRAPTVAKAHSYSQSSVSPPRFYVPTQVNETTFRTSQMEPSPAMQIPTFRGSNTVGRSMGKRIHANGDGDAMPTVDRDSLQQQFFGQGKRASATSGRPTPAGTVSEVALNGMKTIGPG
ncbi:hypothetical protein D9619_001487 [Psilocybe cf. subviscida]|uniref:LysM domain-containing protein n=1 Tax=Psilocybe cf. subviscida TaxID=2480587 RepID=A0A8H5BE07_9AGAR|nr:hypothetical protein D9619_001487 [Psilocybe cf. subviscida]